jgi:hypothetical protein
LASVLQLSDFATSFTVNCDASGLGFSAILHQGVGPIAFFSCAISPHHAKLTVYERELIDLVKAVRHWRPYLWTRSFMVRTDHYSLKFRLDQRLSTILQHAWVSKLFDYQFQVEFKPGLQNAATDALSRRDEDPIMVNALSPPEFELMDQFHQESGSLPSGLKLKPARQTRHGRWSIASSSTTGASSFHRPRPYGRWLSSRPMAWVMRVSRRRNTAFVPPSSPARQVGPQVHRRMHDLPTQ